MSSYDEPNHLVPVIESTRVTSNYSDDEMKCFQHGMASPFMPRELIKEIAEETKADLKRRESEFEEFCNANGWSFGGVNEK